MTASPAVLRYQRPDGSVVTARVADRHPEDTAVGLPPGLRLRTVKLEGPDGVQELRELSARDSGGIPPSAAYDRIDREVLAGLRLARWGEVGPHPPQLRRLEGCAPPGEPPFALLQPPVGTLVEDVAGQLVAAEQRAFVAGLLLALRWMSAAGVAHRALSPWTVRWDGRTVQVGDFTSSSLIGTPRSLAGSPPWAPREQLDGRAAVGPVSDRDDVWAAGRLLFYAVTGSEPSRPELAAHPQLSELLQGVFSAPAQRPAPVELLRRARLADPVRRLPPPDEALDRGRDEFFRERARKHPELVRPAPPAPTLPGAAPRPALDHATAPAAAATSGGWFGRKRQSGGSSRGR